MYRALKALAASHSEKARANDDRSLRMRNSLIQGDRIIRGAQIMDTL